MSQVNHVCNILIDVFSKVLYNENFQRQPENLAPSVYSSGCAAFFLLMDAKVGRWREVLFFIRGVNFQKCSLLAAKEVLKRALIQIVLFNCFHIFEYPAKYMCSAVCSICNNNLL